MHNKSATGWNIWSVKLDESQAELEAVLYPEPDYEVTSKASFLSHSIIILAIFAMALLQ
jgi:hypothetical protein